MVSKQWAEFGPESKFPHPISLNFTSFRLLLTFIYIYMPLDQFVCCLLFLAETFFALFWGAFFTIKLGHIFTTQFNPCSAGNLEPRLGNHCLKTLGLLQNHPFVPSRVFWGGHRFQGTDFSNSICLCRAKMACRGAM